MTSDASAGVKSRNLFTRHSLNAAANENHTGIEKIFALGQISLASNSDCVIVNSNV